MKKRSFSPFIGQFFVATLLFLGVPALLLCTKSVQITVNNQYGSVGIILIISVLCLYFYYLAAHFVPGVSAIFDLITSNSITSKLTYVNSCIANQMFSARRSKIDVTPKAKKRLSDSYYLRVILADKRGKTSYATTFFHQMESGKSYTVTYGKYSKILLSVLSEQGEEILFDVE